MSTVEERLYSHFEARAEKLLTSRRARRNLLLKIVGAVMALGLVFSIIGFANNWGRTAVDIVSPANVKAQHELVIGHYNALRAASQNACSAQKAEARDKNNRAPVLVEAPLLAYEATARNIIADYNSAVENLFKAKIVMPSGYPASLQLNQLDTSDWCTVTTQLDLVKG